MHALYRNYYGRTNVWGGLVHRGYAEAERQAAEVWAASRTPCPYRVRIRFKPGVDPAAVLGGLLSDPA